MEDSRGRRRTQRAALLAQRLQLAGQRIGPLRDVAGAETDHVVAGLSEALHDAGKLRLAGQSDYLAVAAGANGRDQMIAVDAFDWRLAGRIDLGDDHGVGVVEAGRERLEQRFEPPVAVRLQHRAPLAPGWI